MHEKTTLCTLLAYFYSFSSFQGCNLDLLNASITLLAFQCNVFGMFASSHLDTGLFVSNWTPMNLMLKSIQESLKFSSCQCKSPQTYKGNLDGKSVFWDLLKDSVKHVKNIFKTSWSRALFDLLGLFHMLLLFKNRPFWQKGNTLPFELLPGCFGTSFSTNYHPHRCAWAKINKFHLSSLSLRTIQLGSTGAWKLARKKSTLQNFHFQISLEWIYVRKICIQTRIGLKIDIAKP